MIAWVSAGGVKTGIPPLEIGIKDQIFLEKPEVGILIPINWFEVTTLTCCNVQVKQHYCTMVATATGNCAVTNVTYNESTYYVVTLTVYLESSMYLRRRQWLGQIVVMCHIAFWLRSGASLTSFSIQASKPSSALFPRKCTYAKVIDLRNMVLWSIGFIANRYRIRNAEGVHW